VGDGSGLLRVEAGWVGFESRTLAEIDFGSDRGERQAALDTALAAARPRDALSLWHLLSRVEAADRVVSSTEGILRGDRAMRDLWWDELGLGSADFWRDWTGRWSDR